MAWGGFGCYVCKKEEDNGNMVKPDSKTVMAIQGVTAAIARSVSASITISGVAKKKKLIIVKNCIKYQKNKRCILHIRDCLYILYKSTFKIKKVKKIVRNSV